jgi:multidrug efflux pump
MKNFSTFFVTRPIFAIVISVMILIVGAISLRILPVSQYPEVVPPTIQVRAVYPGANPETIANTVASPIEQEINGVENMLYMNSQSTADGVMSLTVTFKLGTDLDIAQMQVQNRVSNALPRLPEEVRRLGVTTLKASPDLMLVVHMVSPDGRYDQLYLANYARLNIRDQLARLSGVGDARVFGGGEYSMRVWLDPDRIASRNLTAGDVVRAIREQNVQVAAGTVGEPPLSGGTEYQLSINTQGRLTSAQQFLDIVIRAGEGGQMVRLKDVARVELGGSSYALRSQLNNVEAAAIPIFLRPGANALDTSREVKATMERLKERFPPGVDYRVVYDTTIFVQESIDAVVKTFFEALALVVLVVVVFLQTWRAAIIPLVAVPVSIIGTFAVMQALGFSINNLSLFGLVLAIGIVVDDAIVVVENVERHIAEGLSPREATIKAMGEVTGPIIAITLVLVAVFVPTAFIAGVNGEFYRQFALTIAASTAISAFNSLTLSPALTAILLPPHGAPPDRFQRLIDAGFGWFFRGFNKVFERGSLAYASGVRRVLRVAALTLLVYGGLVALTGLGFSKVPAGFIPAQDKGYLVVFVQLPNAATLERTQEVVTRASQIIQTQEGVQGAVAFPGLSVITFGNAPNTGTIFVSLKGFDERGAAGLSADRILGELQGKLGVIQDAFVGVFPAPPILGLGSLGGFKLYVQDRANEGLGALYENLNKVIDAGRKEQGVVGLFSSWQYTVPQLYADVDREKAKAKNVDMNELYQTMQVYLGSLYVNDFNLFGRTYQVIAQADSPFRLNAEDVGRLKTRNAAGEMIPLGALMTVREITGPDRVVHYNMFPAAEINGAAAPGFSSGQAVSIMEKLAQRELPLSMGVEWTELTYQEILAGNTAPYVFALCVLLVFLVLAALYESWTLPLAIILIVPMTLLCAIWGVWLRGGDSNIFTQVALLVLVGLACKNAILIVEFAKERYDAGMGRVEAAIEACRLRLRPILMTSFAFIMGVVPLAIASGAGAEMRQALGTPVFFGMLGVTFFGLILTPVFFVLIEGFTERLTRGRHGAGYADAHPSAPRKDVA